MEQLFAVTEEPILFKIPLCNSHRKFKQIRLNNGLTALLISDPTAYSSTATLCAKSGYFQDPETLPGLSHLCEHVLFSGTDEYPGSNTYIDQVVKYGGQCNAYTLSENTVFQVSIPNASIIQDSKEPAFFKILKYFASQFKCPSFKYSSVKDEIGMVDLEHTGNIGNIEKTFIQALKHISYSDHPFSKFSTGNRKSLSNEPDRVVQRLLKNYFKENFYGRNMSLVIIGKHSINILQKLVISEFEGISEKPSIIKSSSNLKLPWCPMKTGKFLQISFELENPNLRITFPLHNNSLINCFQRAWCDILGNETDQSLLSILKKENLVNSIFAYVTNISSECNILVVELTLTSKGLRNPMEVVKILFAYLNKIHQLMSPKKLQSYLKQCHVIDLLNFYYSIPESNELDEASRVIENMTCNHLLKENVFQGFNSFTDLLDDWGLITNVFIRASKKYLILENCNVVLFNSNLKTYNMLEEETINFRDMNYNFNLKISNLNLDQLDSEINSKDDSSYCFPGRNPFLLTSINEIELLIRKLSKSSHEMSTRLSCFDIVADKVRKYPILYDHSKNHEVWVKNDHCSQQFITFQYINCDIMKSCKNMISLKLVCKLVGKRLKNKLYPSELLGYSWKIYPVLNNSISIGISISGPPQGMRSILQFLISELIYTLDTIHDVTYNEVKDLRIGLRKELEELNNIDSLQRILAASILVLEENIYSAETQIEALEETNIDDIIRIGSSFFSFATYFSALIQINENEEKFSTEINKIISIISGFFESDVKSVLLPSSYKILPGKNYMIELGQSKNETCNVINFYVQLGLRDNVYVRTISKLLSKYIATKASTELRIKHKYGYEIYSGQRIYRKTIGIYIIIISSNYNCLELAERINEFYLDLIACVKSMDEASFREAITHPVLENFNRSSNCFNVVSDNINDSHGYGPSNFNVKLSTNIGSGNIPVGQDYLDHQNDWESIMSKSYRFHRQNGEEEIDLQVVKELTKNEFLSQLILFCSPYSAKRASVVLIINGEEKMDKVVAQKRQAHTKSRSIFGLKRGMKTNLTPEKKFRFIDTQVENIHNEGSIIR